jgi:hypothetical protein
VEPGFKPERMDWFQRKKSKTPACRSSDEVTRDAKDHDAGQDQKGHGASDAALQTGACEMSAHGLWPSDTFEQLTAGSFPGSENQLVPAAANSLPELEGQAALKPCLT